MRRVRPALHAKKMYLSAAFEAWAGGTEALLQEAQLRGGLSALGCAVTDAEVRAMFEKMASDPQAGASCGSAGMRRMARCTFPSMVPRRRVRRQ